MPILEWNDTFLLGIKDFDSHHEHLIGLLNKTYDEFVVGAPVDRLENVIYELIDYATYHFAAEEDWMEKNSCPNIEDHKKQHDCFTENVLCLQNDFIAGKSYLNAELLSFLTEWISTHILKTDAEYSNFISSSK